MNKKDAGVICLFIFLTIFTFRNYFFNQLVPFSANLLGAFYQPWVSYSWTGFPNGPHSKPINFDALRLYYPIRHILQDQISHGQIPLWNPYYFSGNVLVGTYQSGVFHPLAWLYFLFSEIDSWAIIIILQPVITSIGMYFFLRELGLQRITSVFGAIGFAFSGIMITWWEEGPVVEYSFLTIPYIFWAIHYLYNKKNICMILLLIASLTWSILSGSFQMSLYVFVASLLWTIVLFMQHKKENMMTFLLIIGTFFESILLTSIQLIPSFEIYLHSLRRTILEKTVFEFFLADWKQIITFIAPDFFGNPAVFNYFGKGFYHEMEIYVGIPVLLFALYNLLQFQKTAIEQNFMKIMLFISLLMGFSSPITWFLLYTLHFPIVSEMTPSRIFFLAAFFFACLGSFGLQHYISRERKPRYMIYALSMLVVFFITGWISAFLYHHFSQKEYLIRSNIPLRNMVLPTILFVVTMACTILLSQKRKLFSQIGTIGILGIGFFGMWIFADKYLFFSQRQFVFPPVPVLTQLQKIESSNRFWSIGNAHIYTNLAMYYKLYSPEGYDSFNINRYNEFVYASRNNGLSIDGISRADAIISPAKDLSEIVAHNSLQRILSLLGVKYIIAKYTDVPLKSEEAFLFHQVWTDDKFTIYEYRHVLPRVFLTDSYQVIAQPQKELQVVYNKNTNVRKTVFLEEPIAFYKTRKPFSGNANITNYAANEILIATSANGNGLLFLSDPYYPGWKVYIDGKETTIYRADYAFRAVQVPAGKHTVRFVYQPLSFTFGALLTIFGICILVVGFSYMKIHGSFIKQKV